MFQDSGREQDIYYSKYEESLKTNRSIQKHCHSEVKRKENVDQNVKEMADRKFMAPSQINKLSHFDVIKTLSNER